MDRRLAIAQRCGGCARKNRLDFGNERERQFFRSFCAQVETSRRENFSVDCDSFVENGVEQLVAAFPGPEQTDIGQIEL